LNNLVKSGLVCLCMFFATAMPVHASGSSDLSRYEQVTLKLLLSENVEELRLGIRNVIYNHQQQLLLQDVVAHILVEYDQGSRAFHTDNIALLVRALGESESKRYLPFAQKNTKHNVGKIAKYARRAARKMNSDAEPLTVDQNWRVSAATLLLSKPVGSEKLFRSVSRPMIVEKVLADLGVPNKVEIVNVSKHKPWVGMVREPFLTLNYTGVGRVIFNWIDKQWQVHKVQAFHAGGESAGDMKDKIQTDNAQYLRSLARRMYDTNEKDDEVLSFVVARLRQDIATKDKNLVDALAWFCKVLGQAADPKYLPVLKEIAAKAGSSKLRRHAKKAVKMIPKQGHKL